MNKSELNKRETNKRHSHYLACEKYNQTSKGKIAQRNGRNRFRALHPKRVKAASAVNNAIKLGKMPQTNTLQCHFCTAQAQQYHHHKGYEPEYWLDVLPVCRKCHRKVA